MAVRTNDRVGACQVFMRVVCTCTCTGTESLCNQLCIDCIRRDIQYVVVEARSPPRRAASASARLFLAANIESARRATRGAATGER